MKKFLIVLGMLTCLFGLTACGSSEEAATDVAIPLMTEAEATQTAEQLIQQIDQIVDSGMADYYAGDEVASAAIASWQAALEEMGEFQEILEYDTTITEEQATIVVRVQGAEKTATVTMMADGVVVYVDGDLFAEAFLEIIDGNHKFLFFSLSRSS